MRNRAYTAWQRFADQHFRPWRYTVGPDGTVYLHTGLDPIPDNELPR